MSNNIQTIAKLQARIAELEAEIAQLHESMQESYEVYAGMEGFISKTAPEAYALKIINDMAEALYPKENDK